MDQFTEATQQTWLSRVTGSIKGVLAGIGRAHSEITEVARSLEDLPQSVVETLQRQDVEGDASDDDDSDDADSEDDN
ncbi:MAG: hypothetical protein ACYTEI_02730 [Planctomycetota bacterium]|jgi:hypothetical protein